MATLAQLMDRIQMYLQDETAEAWPLVQVEAQLREVIAQMARQQLLGDVVWQGVVAGEPEHTFDGQTVTFAEVVYDGRSLRRVQEDAMTRLRRDWDQVSGPPQYYTEALEPPETVRLIPVPLHTGVTTPVTPPRVITGPVEANLVAYRWQNPQGASDTDFRLPEVLEDVAVFLTVAALSGQDGEFHDKQKGQSFQALAQVIIQAVLGGM